MDNDAKYSALEVARYVIAHCTKVENPISNLQLQVILYYLQGYYISCFDKPLFNDPIVAWRLCPVVVDVNYEYQYFGADAIYADNVNFELNDLTPEERNLIDAVMENKALKSAWQLMKEARYEKPWRSTKLHEIISNVKIKKYFYDYLTLQFSSNLSMSTSSTN